MKRPDRHPEALRSSSLLPDERAIAGMLLVCAVDSWPRILAEKIGPEHFTDPDCLRVFGAAHRLHSAGHAVVESKVKAESGLSDEDAARLVDAASLAYLVPRHAERLRAEFLRRRAAAGLAEAKNLQELRALFGELMSEARAATCAPASIVPLSALPDPPDDEHDPLALFVNGFIRRGMGWFLISLAGMGKSLLMMQFSVAFAMGREIFGLKPVRALKILIIQSEDDDAEMAWFRNNIVQGFEDCGWPRSEIDLALSHRVLTASVVGATGADFDDRLSGLIRANPDIDLVIINPLLGFLGADVNDNKALSDFLRVALDPVIKPAGPSVLFVHHTSKPPGARDRRGWGTDSFASYVGSGGAEATNWARAVLALMPIDQHPGFFKLVAAKRGKRLGWKDEAGKPTVTRLIAHHEPPLVFWREATADERAEVLGGEIKTERPEPAKDSALIAEHVRSRAVQAAELRRWTEQTFGRTRGRFAYAFFTDHLSTFKLSSCKSRRNGALFFGTAPDAEAAARRFETIEIGGEQ